MVQQALLQLEHVQHGSLPVHSHSVRCSEQQLTALKGRHRDMNHMFERVHQAVYATVVWGIIASVRHKYVHVHHAHSMQLASVPWPSNLSHQVGVESCKPSELQSRPLQMVTSFDTTQSCILSKLNHHDKSWQ